MNYYVYIVLLIGSLVSCSESSRHFPRYEDFPDEKVLNAQVIHLDTALFRYPFRIAVKDGIAIIMDLHNVDYFFHAFSYPEWEYMTSFGKRGEGPEEMVSADCFRFISKDSIWTLDANKMRTTRWKIEQNMNNIIPVETIDMDKRLVRALDFYPMESGFLVSDYLGEYRQKWTDREGKWIHSANQIPTENNYEDIARPALAQAWRSFFDYNPQKGILVMATQLGEALEIYNFTDTTQTVRYGPNGEPQFAISRSEGIPTGIMGFSDVHITDHFIYAVFHGRSFKDIEQAYLRGEEIEDGGRYIYVFDIKGNPVRKYVLDHAIYGINVDEDTGTILATDVNSNDPILSFKI